MRTILILLFFGMSACADYCPVGEKCDRSCPPESLGICGPSDLCLCSSEDRAATIAVPLCRPASIGDLRITEVLIDGEPTEDAEFIEVVNTSVDDVSLAGITVLSTRGTKLVKRVLFLNGCIPAGSAVAMYGSQADWVWSQPPKVQPALDMGSFGFSNSAQFQFVLQGPSGEHLDRVSGGEQQIKAGVSLVRQFGRLDESLLLHTEAAAGRRSSPGLCPNGARYEEGCTRTEGSGCRMPEVGQIRINEVLIDGKNSEDEEFVELVNATDHSLSLAGLQLLSNRGSALAMRAQFLEGCLAAKGAVVLFEDRERWRWQPQQLGPLEVEVGRFGFPNSADFKFVLRDYEGRDVDQLSGSSRLIGPGVSVNRSPDIYGRQVSKHSELGSLSVSPGTCSNGRSFQSACMHTSENDESIVKRLIQGLPWDDLIELD